MSSRRTTSRIGDDEINDLVLKLRALIPEIHQRDTARVSASKILKETCLYIKRLNREVDELSRRLSELMFSLDISSFDADTLRSILMQHTEAKQ